MNETADGRRQRGVMATDAEWERVGRAANRWKVAGRDAGGEDAG